MSLLEGSLLYASPRSPFARRVRLAFQENRIPYEERILDVLKPNSELIPWNPLSRVPALKLKSGQVLIESHLILEFLYDQIASPLRPKDLQDRMVTDYWSAMAIGLCEKSIEWFFETQRPEGQRDEEWLDEIRGVISRVLPLFEKQIRDTDFILPGRLTQADLDMGTALTYMKLRVDSGWDQQFPETARYLETLERRESFQRTAPTPVK